MVFLEIMLLFIHVAGVFALLTPLLGDMGVPVLRDLKGELIFEQIRMYGALVCTICPAIYLVMGSGLAAVHIIAIVVCGLNYIMAAQKVASLK